MAPTLQIIGFKKSGKTTTVNDFLTCCQQLQLTTSVLKHDEHESQMDQANTDTARFSDHGAQQVILATATGVFQHEQVATPPTPQRLRQLVRPNNDLCLMEGFKTADYPKIVLLRPQDQPADFGALTHVLAWASLWPLNQTTVLDWQTPAARQHWFQHYWQHLATH